MKHANSILESFEHYPNFIKIDPYNSEQYRFKVGAFFWDTVYTPLTKTCQEFCSTYWGSCSSMTEAFMTSRLCTGPMLIPAYYTRCKQQLMYRADADTGILHTMQATAYVQGRCWYRHTAHDASNSLCTGPMLIPAYCTRCKQQLMYRADVDSGILHTMQATAYVQGRRW